MAAIDYSTLGKAVARLREGLEAFGHGPEMRWCRKLARRKKRRKDWLG